MSAVCLHGYVSGRVQGVWFRQSTKLQAEESNVSGWAKNLPDGRVEVMLCGEEEDVRRVEAWLYKGPSHAQVTQVSVGYEDWQGFPDFETY